jgi:hypothetical protein
MFAQSEISMRINETDKSVAKHPEEPTTDGWVSRATLRAIVALPKKAQTSVLKFLVRIGPLDELTGDRLVGALLEFGGTAVAQEVSSDALKLAAAATAPGIANDVDIDMLRTIAEAPADYHAPLLRLLVNARPLGAMSSDAVVLFVWERVRSHWTRTMGPKRVEQLTDILVLGPPFDAVLLRFFDDKQTDRFETLEREVQAGIRQQAA